MERRGRGEGADVGAADGSGWSDCLVGHHIGGDEVERRRLVRSDVGGLEARPDLAPTREPRGATAIIDTINAFTDGGTAVVATGAFDGRIPSGPTSIATRPNTDPTRSASWLLMRRLILAVSVPAAHSVLVSAWATSGDVTTSPAATTAVVSKHAARPPIDQG